MGKHSGPRKERKITLLEPRPSGWKLLQLKMYCIMIKIVKIAELNKTKETIERWSKKIKLKLTSLLSFKVVSTSLVPY